MLSMNYFMTIIQIQCVHSIWTLLNTWLRLGTGSCACKTDLPSQTQLFIPEHSGPFISTLCYFQTYGIQINVWVWMVGCFLSTFFVVWIFFSLKKYIVSSLIGWTCWERWVCISEKQKFIPLQFISYFHDELYLYWTTLFQLPFYFFLIDHHENRLIGNSLFAHQYHVWSQSKHRLITHVIPVMSW